MEKLELVFGDENTIYKNFDLGEDYSDIEKTLKSNNNKVSVNYGLFSSEYGDYVDFDLSYTYLDKGKLHIVIYGVPRHISHDYVKMDINRTLEQYIKQGYGELFDITDNSPICVVVERNGKNIIV